MSLFDAVAARDATALEQLLTGGALPDDFDAEGCTPLARAAEAGEAELVRLLLAHGADASFTDRGGESPLLKAATHGHRTVYALLLPLAGEDERDLAARLLRDALGGHALPPTPPPTTPEGWRRALADLTVSLSSLLGDEAPAQRLERALKGSVPRKR
jgi:ankyrin repeat protein